MRRIPPRETSTAVLLTETGWIINRALRMPIWSAEGEALLEDSGDRRQEVRVACCKEGHDVSGGADGCGGGSTARGGALLLHLVLPGLIESRLATSLQGRYRLEEKPVVEVSSDFPPRHLLGRIDRIQLQIDRLRREGLLLRDVHIDLRDVSMLSLLRGDLEREAQAGSLRAEVPKDSINEYLRENTPGFTGEIDVLPWGLVYRSSDALFGLPVNVSLNLRVAGPHTIEAIPEEATVGSLSLPSFFHAH